MRDTLPRIEATHLMLNRGAGLIWSRQILCGEEKSQDNDFVRRNFFKAALAIGDSLLIMNSLHQTRYRGRDSVLEKLAVNLDFPEKETILGLYRRALEFKFSPDRESLEEINNWAVNNIARLFARIFLTMEGWRTGQDFSGHRSYLAATFRREVAENSMMKVPRNLFLNLKNRRFSLRYPRELLYRQLPALLIGSTDLPWRKKSREFMKLWQRFN